MPPRTVFKACIGCGDKYHIRPDHQYHSHECYRRSYGRVHGLPKPKVYRTQRKKCVGCGDIYDMRPRQRFHSISCGRLWVSRQPQHRERFRLAVVERERKRRELWRAGIQRRLEALFGPNGTLAQAYELGRQEGYQSNWQKARRAGYAEGFSAAIGEKPGRKIA
jgi:hypothetical protein